MNRDLNQRDELLQRFEAVVSGAGLDDLRQMLGDLSLLGRATVQQLPQPHREELRRSPLADVMTFRVRVDLRRSKPRIWRRLELRSDLTLDVVHRVLQAAFSWTDTHLWRFSLGGDAFSGTGELFLCPWDVEEGDSWDDGGVPASGVRLDETMQDAGDVLTYVYDFGDNWELTLRLEGVSAAAADAPSAVVLAGRRAAPPEDCGGVTDGAELADLLADPEAFDIDAINTSLRRPYVALSEHNLDRRLIDLINRLAYGPFGEDLERRAVALMSDPGPPEAEEFDEAFRAFTWFLERAAEGEIALTPAGYLRPVDVAAAARVVPTMGGWIGKANRESETTPVLHFRQVLQSLGLLRKYKGALRLTRAGAAAQQAPEELWNRLADTLVPAESDFNSDAALLLLTYAATSADAELPLDEVAAALTAVGWQTDDGRPIERRDLYWVPALEVLRNVTSEPTGWLDRWRISPAAARLARAALQQSR
jgi:Plasmid pRiA4b ORF-3-like protein